MKFEVGKQYKHTTGIYMSIVGELDTTMWGKTLIGEATHDSYGLMPVGQDEASAINWSEVTHEEWMKQFEPHQPTESEVINDEADNIR